MWTLVWYVWLMVISAVVPWVMVVVCSEFTVQFAEVMSNWSKLIWTVRMVAVPSPMFWTYMWVEVGWKLTLWIWIAVPALCWTARYMYAMPATRMTIVMSRIAVAMGASPVSSDLRFVLCIIFSYISGC
jgi:hypothetical protein